MAEAVTLIAELGLGANIELKATRGREAETGTVVADWLVRRWPSEVPAPLILHFESPSPFTPLGAKGVGEGNCMSTPVCIANAVADALSLAEIDLPLTPAKLAALLPREAA